MHWMRATLLCVVLLGWSAGAPALAEPEKSVTIFAAASLTNALKDVTDAAQQSLGIKVKLSFASSSTLAKQIEAGAAADIFISADEPWMDYLAKRSLIDPASRQALLRNRLVVIVPKGGGPRFDVGDAGAWRSALPAGRIAVGDPAHVPAGKYAADALKHLGLLTEFEPRFARADNVRAALVLVERGEAVAGIVYETDAAASKLVDVVGTFPETSHAPIVYPIARLKVQTSGDAARLFDHLTTSSAARATFLRHGFAAP